MDLTFININDRKNAVEGMKIEDLKLSSHNPRYNTLSSLNDNLLEKITDTGDKTQNEVMIDLLSNEGDFADLKNLFESILNIGFDSLGEAIILVEGKEKKSFFVAEGNRRTMCLKFICNSDDIELLELEKINNINNQESLIMDDDEDEKLLRKRRKDNFQKVKELIEEIKKKYSEFSVVFQLVKNDEELWKLIYTKHIAGDRPGMRKWTRGKYFTDILSFFKNGISLKNNLNEKIRRSLQREPNTIIDDFKHAQFVKAILKNANYDADFEEVTDKMIFGVMRKIKVSALQSNFSLKKIRDSAHDYLNISNKVFEEKYFKYFFDENNIISFDDKNKDIPYNDILKFIYKYFSKNIITTRPVKIEHIDEFNREVKKLLQRTNINTREKQSAETLKKMDSFDYSINELEEIIFNAKSTKIEEPIISRFIVTKSIKENNFKIEKLNEKLFFKKGQPSEVFIRLKEQYIHNAKRGIFLNAMGTTTRSMLEQLIIWGLYFEDTIIEEIIPGGDGLSAKKERYLEKIAGSTKIHALFRSIRRHHFSELDINRIINNLTNSNKNIEAKFISENEEEIDSILNELIHASHRIYINSNFVESLKRFNKWQEVIFSITNDINAKNIGHVNSKIQLKIS